jgi:hypothetical protein
MAQQPFPKVGFLVGDTEGKSVLGGSAMRKALSGILVSLFTSAALFSLSFTVNADEYVQGYSSKDGADIQPFDRADRDMMNPANTYSPPENVNSPGEKATEDADSYRQPSQRPHRFGAEGSSELFYRFQYGR